MSSKDIEQALMIPTEKTAHLQYIGTQLMCDPRKVADVETVRFLYQLLLEQAGECRARVVAVELALHRERMRWALPPEKGFDPDPDPNV